MLGPTYRAELPEEAVLTNAPMHCHHCEIPTKCTGFISMIGPGATQADEWEDHACPLCGQRYSVTSNPDTFTLLVDLQNTVAEDLDDDD